MTQSIITTTNSTANDSPFKGSYKTKVPHKKSFVEDLDDDDYIKALKFKTKSAGMATQTHFEDSIDESDLASTQDDTDYVDGQLSSYEKKEDAVKGFSLFTFYTVLLAANNYA